MTEPLSPLGSTFSPKQRGRAEGEEERGRWRRNRKRSWSGRRAGGKAKARKEGDRWEREGELETGNVPADIIRVGRRAV